MSDKINGTTTPVGHGQYDEYSDLLVDLKRTQKQCPKGVGIKLERGNSLSLQFVNPDTGKRTSRGISCSFTRRGLVDALDKAYMVSEALKRYASSSEFWNWYSDNIAIKNNIESDRLTYKQIFKIIEDNYFNGKHRNTGRKRERDITKPGGLSDRNSFNRVYGVVFNKFNDADDYPTWDEIKRVWDSFNPGSKSFKDTKSVMLAIAELVPNNSKLIKQIKSVNSVQTIFNNKQSIDLDTFLKWYTEAYNSLETIQRDDHRNAKRSWLWVASMCMLYGLRPSEIAASLNLTDKYSKDGIIIYPITDIENNPECTLVIGEFTYFGTSTKTGFRVVNPVPLKHLWEQLKIRNPLLPIYTPKQDSKPKNIVEGFDKSFDARMKSYSCPVSQQYAFRHLYNQLLEMCGVSTTIRSRLMGHSETTNSGTYKKRRNLKTELDIINNSVRQPLSYDLAVSQLKSLCVDVDDINVNLILKVVYQLG